MNARSDAWTDEELSLLYEFVHDEDWFEQVQPYLGRSDTAIRSKMCALRREAEIVPKNCGPKALSRRAHRAKRAAAGSRKLALALLALDADSSPVKLAEDESAAPVLSEHERLEADMLRQVAGELVEGQCEVQLTFLDGPLFEWRDAA